MKPTSFYEEDRKVYKGAIEKWGTALQTDMMIEECSELTKALIKKRRGKGSDRDVCEEIADVEIMLEQMKLIFNEDVIQRIKRNKIFRLSELLKND